MVLENMEFDGSRDLTSRLPDALNSHILSFLPTKEAATTSVLSKKWRYLFAFGPNLDFDDTRRNKLSTSFTEFVDRVLALRGNSRVHKFSLKIKDDGDDPVVTTRIFPWILNVLERGVSDLFLYMELESESLLPLKVFLSDTLVRLKLEFPYAGPSIEVDNEDYVDLPKLKTLHLESVHFENHGIGLTNLLSGCHVLEDLVLNDISWFIWDFSCVSVTTLKRLTFRWEERDENPKSVSIDTPNLVYLDFTDTIADKYPKVKFDALVEARICLRMSDEQISKAKFLEEENEMVGNATDFIMGLCNVKILYLSADTLEVLTYCCEVIPLFNNLTHLTIENNPKVGWESLPGLLNNSPNLETLVFQGLYHKATARCGDVCLCKPFEGEEEEEKEIPSCLLSSPVKVLKIMKFGENSDYFVDMRKQREQIKYFLETMPNLEQVILHYNTSVDENVIKVARQLQRLISRVASTKCIVQLISDNLSLSSVVSTNGLVFFRSTFPV